MANQLKMAEVQAILTLHGHGWSNRRIARELGIHRETVGRHVRLAAKDAAKPASAPPGPELAAVCMVTGSAGAPPGSGDIATDSTCSKPASAPPGSAAAEAASTSAAWPWREVIIQKLDQGLCARRIYQDLCSPDHGYSGSYYSVRRLVTKLTDQLPLPVRRMECVPGAEAQVDFGKGAPVVGPDGRRRSSWVFRIVLSHSRKGYSEAVSRQGTDEFLRCLENAFAHFGGVPRTLVIDNLKAAVSRADWFDPELCPKARSFAEHYGTAILPTKPYTPRHKGKVENGVKYVKRNALAGMNFASLAEENRHLLEWEATVADTRIHGTTRRQVVKVFTEVEKPALMELPAGRFELFHEALRSVHRDGHVQVKGAYYSVPPEYLGQQVWARWDGRTVRLFDQRMRPIAVHAQKSPGTFSTLSVHLHPHKISGIEKGTAALLRQVECIGPQARAWSESMLASRGIQGVRVLMGLLSLSKRHPRQAIERACEIAQGHGAYHLRSLRQLIHRQDTPPIQQGLIQEHPIIRGLGDYGQWLRDVLTQEPLPKECLA
jgi:transposase